MNQGGGSLLEVRPYLLRAAIGGRVFGRQVNQGAVAAQVSRMQLFNPLGSGVVIVIWRITGGSGVNVTHLIRSGIAALGTLDGVGTTLRPGVGTSVGEVRRDTIAASGGTTLDYFITSAVETINFDTNGTYILDPGNGITVVLATVNVEGLVSFVWEEISAL